ncbi:MAG: diaminopimelate epimerase [Acidobacteria bacterium]|nr:MAG: diaminopimelate epimerase [Acidobacteriota bacterium]REK12143.1 MAG: diaminopimelate epimerase [Acidobacteriota bacterium]
MRQPRQPFWKMSGAGNDFIVLTEPAAMPDAESIRSWCRRGTSLGADGLIVLSRAATGGGRARLRMAYFNADGGRADLCGNGSRCAALLGFELGWARDRLDLETDVGVLAAHRLAEDRVRVDVPDPAEPARRLDLDETPARLETGLPVHGWWLTVGVPHLVLLLGEDSIRLDRLDIAAHAPALRHHPALGDAGANVDFVRPLDDLLELRTWERGVEGETLACGSGAVAAALVAAQLGVARLPCAVRVRSGEVLRIGRGEQPAGPGGVTGKGALWQEGPAAVIARGDLY